MPVQASNFAPQYDALFIFLLVGCTIITLGVAALIVFFSIRYRRRSDEEVPPQTEGALKLELAWTITPLVLALIVFVWGAYIYVKMYRPPTNAYNINVVARQWMWKAEQPNGIWENNEVHVPVGQAVRLTMTSEDVIHDFYVPQFRTKMDVVPGKYTSEWFIPTKAGTYDLFCAEYCGTYHSRMIGTVTAMEPRDFEAWLTNGGSANSGSSPASPAAQGAQLFKQFGCITCHTGTTSAPCPNLAGLYGSKVKLSTGQTVTADAAYIRESILNSQAKIVAGYQPIMPIFQGQISEAQVLDLIAYIQSLPANNNPLNNPPGSGSTGGSGQGASGAGSSGLQTPTSGGGSNPTLGGQGSQGGSGGQPPTSGGGSNPTLGGQGNGNQGGGQSNP